MFLRGFNFYYIVLQASKRLHQRMLRTVLYTPIHFFDTNPSGRILKVGVSHAKLVFYYKCAQIAFLSFLDPYRGSKK